MALQKQPVVLNFTKGQLDMLPVFSLNYKSNSSSTNIEFSSNGLHSSAAKSVDATYFYNLSFREFRSTMSRTFDSILSSLVKHIPSIVSSRANKQMIWINATTIVTSMTHEKTGGYRTFKQLIRKPMSTYSFMIKTKSTVAASNQRFIPYPARFGFGKTSEKISCSIFWHHTNKMVA